MIVLPPWQLRNETEGQAIEAASENNTILDGMKTLIPTIKQISDKPENIGMKKKRGRVNVNHR